jgi:hypothetical protein
MGKGRDEREKASNFGFVMEKNIAAGPMHPQAHLGPS